jgi:hypothetical protein
MNRNIGTVDRATRFTVGVVMMGVGFGALGGAAAIVVGIIGAVLFVTSLIGWCPLYIPFRISTFKV